jgi:hypothetical protein
MGHSSTRAALIYLYATRERDQQIAAGMDKLFKDARRTARSGIQTGVRTRDIRGLEDRSWSIRLDVRISMR